jgi:mRNA-degrading endonuclease HigB of HigAB toxin-antitoxin module
MHVIAKLALVEFWMKHPDAENPLQAWYCTMESNVFMDLNDLRATFASQAAMGPSCVKRKALYNTVRVTFVEALDEMLHSK